MTDKEFYNLVRNCTPEQWRRYMSSIAPMLKQASKEDVKEMYAQFNLACQIMEEDKDILEELSDL